MDWHPGRADTIEHPGFLVTSPDDARPKDGLPFAQVPDWMLTASVSMQAKLVYWALRAHVNRERGDDRCWPSMDALAEMLGLKNRQSIAKYVRELEEFGAIEVEKNPSSTRRQYVYTVRQQPPRAFDGAVSIAGWHRARYERMDAEQAPACTAVHLGAKGDVHAGPCTGMHENHTNATHTNATSGTAPSGGHACAAGTSSSNFSDSIIPRRPKTWHLRKPGDAAQHCVKAFVACLEAAGLPVYDQTVNSIGHHVKVRLERGEKPLDVWDLYVKTVKQALAGELAKPKAA